MSDSPVSVYLQSLVTKLANSSFITDAGNVIVGESYDLLSLSGDTTKFPRLEILITKDKADGYSNQRKMNMAFRYSIAGYILRDSDDVVLEDMVELVNFGTEVRSLNFQFLDDKQSGSPPCVDFIKMGEYPECFYEYELLPKLSAFICEVEAEMYISDTVGL